MRKLDARYFGLRNALDQYGEDYISRVERKRIEEESGKALPAVSAPKVIGLIFVALVVGFLAGRWYQNQLIAIPQKQHIYTNI